MLLLLFPNNNGYNPTKDNSLQSMEAKSIQFFNYTATNNFLANISLYLPNACNFEKNNKIIIREKISMRNIFNGFDLIQLIKLQNTFKDINYKHLGFSSREQKVERRLYLKIYLL